MIIDFHTHVFPDNIAERTLQKLVSLIGVQPYTDATIGGLKASMKEGGVDYSVILPIVTKPEQFDTVNRFAATLNNQKGFVSFGGIHPATKDMKEQIDKLTLLGFKGIKLHPDFQDMYIDDVQYIHLITYAILKGLAVVIHAGLDEGLPDPVHCPPKRILTMLEKVGKYVDTSKIILAHMGGFKMWDDVLELLAGKRVYFDTGFCMDEIYKEIFVKIIKRHGADKILFGTDSPWSAQKEGIEFIANLPIKKEEKEKILGENAKKIIF